MRAGRATVRCRSGTSSVREEREFSLSNGFSAKSEGFTNIVPSDLDDGDARGVVMTWIQQDVEGFGNDQVRSLEPAFGQVPAARVPPA